MDRLGVTRAGKEGRMGRETASVSRQLRRSHRSGLPVSGERRSKGEDEFRTMLNKAGRPATTPASGRTNRGSPSAESLCRESPLQREPSC